MSREKHKHDYTLTNQQKKNVEVRERRVKRMKKKQNELVTGRFKTLNVCIGFIDFTLTLSETTDTRSSSFSTCFELIIGLDECRTAYTTWICLCTGRIFQPLSHCRSRFPHQIPQTNSFIFMFPLTIRIECMYVCMYSVHMYMLLAFLIILSS